MTITVTRFAPSPTGLLHLGHAHSALFTWRAAQDAGGRFLLRIEDIDLERCRPAFEAAIFEDLAWLGLTWEQPVRRQSEHLDDYRTVVQGLQARGLLYPCFCTRKEIRAEVARAGRAPHGPEGPLYPGTCRSLSVDERESRIARDDAHALRLDLAAALEQTQALDGTGELGWEDLGRGRLTAEPELLGDVVLARKEVPASYHLTVTWDDALQGISLVTRGADLFHSTHVHRLLQALLDLPTPLWHHHDLLTDESGKRLAKRHDALSLRALREAGRSPAEVRALAGFPD